MQVVVVTRPGGPEVLRLCERPEPSPGPGELLVEVCASALNRADLLQRRGRYPAPAGVPADVPGLEFAGRVMGHGEGTGRFCPGDRVMGIVGGGAHAERLVVPEDHCLGIPNGLDWEEAAALPEAALTSYAALFEIAATRPGETVLISAAGSGVGTAAVQIAAAAGARVIGWSRSEAKRARLTDLGTHVASAPEAGTDAFDVVLDLVGGGAWSAYLPRMNRGGRLVLIGLLGGRDSAIDVGPVLLRQLTITGTMLRPRSGADKARLIAGFAREVLPWIASGAVRPVIHAAFRFEAVAEAHALMERNENFGKIVLTP